MEQKSSRRYRWPGGVRGRQSVPPTLTQLAQRRLISPRDFWEGVAKVYYDDRGKPPFFQKR
jgi:hypothetical protein